MSFFFLSLVDKLGAICGNSSGESENSKLESSSLLFHFENILNSQTPSDIYGMHLFKMLKYGAESRTPRRCPRWLVSASSTVIGVRSGDAQEPAAPW